VDGDSITIPVTTRTRYLSGMAALNLYSSEGTGDWHLVETFFRSHTKRSRTFLAGTDCVTDTNALLGDIGVFECSALLDRMGIPHPTGEAYAANHARAIVDLVLGAVMNKGSPDFVTLDDWMPQEKDKQAVFDLMALALPRLPDDQQKKVTAWQATNAITG
jgi:hypothetical protein